MKKIIFSGIVIGFLFTVSIFSVAVFGLKEIDKTQGIQIHGIPIANIYIDDDNVQGPWDGSYKYPYQHIQDGINSALDNYTIFVFSGIYEENLIINKSIKLIGQNRESTIIDGRYIDDTIRVCSSFVKISGLSTHVHSLQLQELQKVSLTK